jgi:hypothetical protein
MTQFGYSEADADKLHVRLDRDLKSLEHYADRIAHAVPQAGATTAPLEQIKDTAREVVADLNDVVDGRTEIPA